VHLWSPVAIALSGLGVLTAVANLLSAYGSKFWQENWEKHINMLEDNIEGRLYKTIWLSKKDASKLKASFTVTGVNLSVQNLMPSQCDVRKSIAIDLEPANGPIASVLNVYLMDSVLNVYLMDEE
jgi:hypothetical protein